MRVSGYFSILEKLPRIRYDDHDNNDPVCVRSRTGYVITVFSSTGTVRALKHVRIAIRLHLQPQNVKFDV